MRHIIILTNALSGGGAEASALILQKELTARSFDVTLIGINKDNPFNIPTTTKVFSLNRDKSKPIRSTIVTLLNFRTFINSQKIDTLIVNCELPELFCLILPRKTQLVIVEHANPTWFQRERLGRFVRSNLRKRKPTLVTVGEHLQPRFFEDLEYVHVPNPIEEIDPREMVITKSEITRLVYLGRLSATFKNPLTALRVAEQTNYPLIMIGDGDMLQSLKSYATKHKIDCVFTGFQVNPWRLIRSGDLLLMPSSAEGDGLTLIEAIQRRVPFLASDIPDLNRYGILKSNYCSSFEEFVNRVNIYRHSLDALVVPQSTANTILESRKPSEVVKKWIKVLFKPITQSSI